MWCSNGLILSLIFEKNKNFEKSRILCTKVVYKLSALQTTIMHSQEVQIDDAENSGAFANLVKVSSNIKSFDF